jgi:hypothetical protein
MMAEHRQVIQRRFAFSGFRPWPKSGRIQPESVAAFSRIQWPFWTGITGRIRPEYAAMPDTGDGLSFDRDSVFVEPIRNEAEYHGLLGESKIAMQVDIGFGNAVEPAPEEIQYVTLLDHPAPKIRAYPIEAVIAEKLHAMIVLGERNSRFKDFYDLYVFTRQFPFKGEDLARAIVATFNRRGTVIDSAFPAALTPRFFAADTRAEQWRAYLTRNSLRGTPADFIAVGELLQAFLVPLWRACADGRPFYETWPASGPWISDMKESTE